MEKTHCFPEFTGRVCPALCEAACTCNLDGLPVATKENEKAIIEHAFEAGYVMPDPPKVRTGKSVAVIGSGPAGLAAAKMLNKRGHMVTVFERSDRIGGLLRYGIPNMKLEKSIIHGGKNITKEELLKNFDRILLACGASNPRDISVPGRDGKNIYFAVEFLTSVTKSLLDSNLKDKTFIPAKGKHVLVIGGGDTGNDCVGTAIRLGAKPIVQLEMMPQPPKERTASNPWPQWPRILKTDYGQEEAAALFGKDPRVYQTTVKEFKKDKNGNVKKAVLIRLEAKKDEKSGRMQMTPIEGSEETIDADLVLIAAGFTGSQKYVTNAFSVSVDARTNVAAGEDSYETNVPGIFPPATSAGDSLLWFGRFGKEEKRQKPLTGL